MNRICTGQSWFDRLIPEGIPTHTSTLISGPGGSGKPLIGNLITAAWLRQGGSVVFMSLQYPSHEFIMAGLKKVTQLDLDEYKKRVVFIELDITQEEIVFISAIRFKANLVKPDILVFGSALNLLLFSPTYSKVVLERMKNTIQNDKRHTYLFSVSTTVKGDEIAKLEGVADNLIQSYSLKRPFRLFMRIVRVKDLPFIPDEIQVPFPSDLLEEVKEIADHSRLRVIPLIQKL